MELVDTLASKASAARREGSNPSEVTMNKVNWPLIFASTLGSILISGAFVTKNTGNIRLGLLAAAFFGIMGFVISLMSQFGKDF